MVQNRISTGMHHLVHSYVDIYKRKEMESIKDDLVHLYASSRKRFTKISDEKIMIFGMRKKRGNGKINLLSFVHVIFIFDK